MDEDLQTQLTEIDGVLATKLVGGDDGAVIQQTADQIAEEEAARKGWVPKEKYRGDPSKWKPASQFLEDGKRYQKNLETRLERLERENEELKRSGKAFAEYHDQQMQSKQREIDDAIKQLRVQKSQATAEGEHTLAVELEDRIELLKEEKAGLKKEEKQEVVKPKFDENGRLQAANPADQAILDEWISDGNEWFDNNPTLRDVAMEYGAVLAKETKVRGRKFLDQVAEHVRENFPRQFAKMETKQERRNDQVEGNTVGSNDRKGNQYSIHDLPAEDLALMREFIKNGWTTQEKYLANYFGQERKAHRTASKQK